jgi:FlaA1/EpsC-like NDP-sugar epimerase
MNSMLKLVGRSEALLALDMAQYQQPLAERVSQSAFLVLGAAGTIGQAVVREIFSRQPKKLHVVDISENNLAELVRDIRSRFGYIAGDFRSFALNIGSVEYDAFFAGDGDYDYVLNLSALKHVRS